MRLAGGVTIAAVAALVGACSGGGNGNAAMGDRTTEVEIHNQSPAIADGPDMDANGQVNMTDPTGAEGIEPALNNSVELQPR